MTKVQAKTNTQSTSRRTLHYFWQEMKAQKKYLLPQLFVAPAALFFGTYATAWIIANIINRLTANPPAAGELWSVFGPQILLYAASIIAGELVLWRLMMWLNWKADVYGSINIAKKCFAALMRQSMSFHGDRFGGSLVSQASRFYGAFENFLDILTWNVAQMFWAMVFTFAILGPIIPLYALILAILAAAFMVIAWFSFKKIRPLNERQSAAYNRLSGQLSDSVTNIAAVKSFAREDFEQKLFAGYTGKLKAASLKNLHASMIRNYGFGAVLTVQSIAIVIFIVGGASWFGIGIGTLVLALTYSLEIGSWLWQFSNTLRQINTVFGDAQQMTKILDEPVLVRDADGAPDLRVARGRVEFRGVSFHHSDARSGEEVFRDFNLIIPAGQRVGLVGHSGSGKTTLTKLLLRFTDVQKGEILIDEQNIATVTQKSLRGNIAYVPQEPLLFHRSIRDNIAYGKLDATDAEIRAAAREANALEFIEKLPQKFATMTGERGVKLSGGQRQRIAIARAILADAPILVLDEATSALDTESEKLIQDALKNLMKNRTSIVIAHRLSTVANLDRIVVLEDGKIVEDGAHAELLSRKNSVYARLWNQQTGMAKE